MDLCNHCREYHSPHRICDGFIEAVREGKVKVSEKTKLQYLEGSVTDLVSSLLYYDRKEDEELNREDIDDLYREHPNLNDLIVGWFTEEIRKSGEG